MQKLLLTTFTIIFSCFAFKSNAQSFINGDFENNSAVSCEYNLTDVEFNSQINNVVAFGKAYNGTSYVGEIDFQTNNCYLDPQNGDWCLGLSTDTTNSSDALSIELSSNLIQGNSYEITCYIYGNMAFRETVANIEIGESLTATEFGQLIHSAEPDTSAWKEVKFIFTASQNSSHITVRTKIGVRGWTQIDNFSIAPATTTSINESSSSLKVAVFPNPTQSDIIIDFDKVVKSGTIQISSLSGQILSTHLINNQQYLKIDISNLPDGMYLLNTVSELSPQTILIQKK